MFEKLGSIIFTAAIAFLAFVGGAMAVLSDQFPQQYLRDAFRAGNALIEQRKETADRYQSDQWRAAQTDARGVTVSDPARTAAGYTLYTTAGDAVARLVAMDGRVVHEWRRPFSTVWTQQAAVKKPQPDDLIYLDKARLFPNGDLLAIYVAAGDTPWGYGMVKLDKDSNVIWSYLGHTHHDFVVEPDGKILALTNEFTEETVPEIPDLMRPRLDDFLAVLSPDGQELKRISLTRALAKSRYKDLQLAIPSYSLDDPLHVNSVDYIGAEKARNFPFAKAGDVLISFRNISAIAVLALDTGDIVWATRGPWLWQHDARLLPNGHITLFDNLGGFRRNNAARVIEIDPKTMALTWVYAGDDQHPLHSPLRSGAQRLANGNTLVTETDGGRLFEVTPDGAIVWNYVNPGRGGDRNEYMPVISGGQRIDPDTLTPDLQALFKQQASLKQTEEASR